MFTQRIQSSVYMETIHLALYITQMIQIYLKVEAKTANVRRASEAGLTRQTVQFIIKTEFDIEILHLHPKVESRHTESFKSA